MPWIGEKMNKEEIKKELQNSDSTVLSFPERGPWGDKKYRGNCSGWIQAFLIWKYKVQRFAELFAGSGTGSDVCKDMGIPYIGADLNPNPVRNDILSVNALTDEVPEQFLGADMLFMHPPYGAEIRIPYANSMWKDTTDKNLSASDLGQMPWNKFMYTLNCVIMKYYAAMESGARMSILMGDVRRGGLHSMLTDIVKPGELQQIIIKQQHNFMSAGKTYQSRNFVPIEHEYLMVLKKLSPYIIDFICAEKHSMDIRDSQSATWRDVISAVMQSKGNCSLDQIYSEVEGYKKCESNPNWKAKVRQVLQLNPNLFRSAERGVWYMAA